jgi:hypothetical protein
MEEGQWNNKPAHLRARLPATDPVSSGDMSLILNALEPDQLVAATEEQFGKHALGRCETVVIRMLGSYDLFIIWLLWTAWFKR